MNEAIETVSQYLQGPALDFFKTQISASKVKFQGYKWSEKDKSFALTLFHSSPKTYKLLANVFALPSVRTLQRTMQKIDLSCGFHTSIFEGLKNRFLSVKPEHRICAVVYDEMAIKQQLIYNSSSDRIDGFETVASHVNSKYIANHAGVFMVRGLCSKWKQSVGYFYSSGPINNKTLEKILVECIEKLIDIGLDVKLVISDQGSNNRAVFDHLKVSENHPYFEVKNSKIFVMYDPPHLI